MCIWGAEIWRNLLDLTFELFWDSNEVVKGGMDMLESVAECLGNQFFICQQLTVGL